MRARKMKVRKVKKAFQAKCYAVEPPRQRNFTAGERVVFLRQTTAPNLSATVYPDRARTAGIRRGSTPPAAPMHSACQ